MKSPKRILFVHQNFPGQFKFLAPALAHLGHEVHAMSLHAKAAGQWRGVRIHPYSVKRGTTPSIHPWVSDFETKTIRGEAAFRAALQLSASGLQPDLIVAHPGWGESLFLKQVWPKAKLAIFCEFYYLSEGADVGFDPEFAASDPAENCRVQLKNLNNLMHMELADAAIAPTSWQASVFPERFRSKITVVHDGIDTEHVRPNPGMSMRLHIDGHTIELNPSTPVVTFVNRNLEPYRGYHVFTRALPRLLQSQPTARVLMIGGNEVSYGARAPDGQSWKDVFWTEVRPQLTAEQAARVHFLGNLSYEHFLAVLQLSTVHVYLTYPFVLSWSLLEAMSAGCAVVGSRTAPVEEVIQDGETGRLVDFFDYRALADMVSGLIADPEQRARLGANARRLAVQHYDLKSVCLPQQLNWVEQLLQTG